MGLVPAEKEFLKQLRALCDEHKTLLIFDEVMSGFRASLKGAFGVVNIKPDIVTFGKVIGGGMPVGAFGANKKIMSKLSPEGSIYQAGTLSGNPVAMSAGVISLKKLKANPEIYKKLESRAKILMSGFENGAREANLPIVTEVRGEMFGFFFTDSKVKNFTDAKKGDNKIFKRFHQKMLKEGVYLACSSYETGFISTATSDDMIDETVETAKKVMVEISEEVKI